MMRLFTQALALLFGAVYSFAQAENDEKPLPRSALIHGAVGLPRPAVELPDYVPAPKGQLTFWADFAHASEDKVPLYLINRTATTQSFSSQDNDLYVKLEFKNPLGKWARAQAHLSSWCGNSYYPVKLPPGHCFVFFGYRSKEGNKQIVRYASAVNETLISIEGEGLISESDIKDAEKDSIATRKISAVKSQTIEPRGVKGYHLFYAGLIAATAFLGVILLVYWLNVPRASREP